MTYDETVAYLNTLPGVLALFWFMENVSDEHPDRQQLFFYCRERVRRYGHTPGYGPDSKPWKRELDADAKLFDFWEKN